MIGALLASLILPLPGCSKPQGRIRFGPEEYDRGLETIRPAFSASLRSRTQHTFGITGENLFPAPGPDGKAIFYSSSRQGPHFAIFRKSLGPGPATVVAGGPWNAIQPTLSPDGRRLAFSSDRDGSWCIYLREEEPGARDRRLTAPESDAFAPSWAPDSRRLAFFRRGLRSGGWEIWTIDADRGTETYICPGLFPAWSRGASGDDWIAYQSPRERDGGWFSIWKIRPDGSRPTELVNNETWGAVHPSWSPDDRWIAFAAVGKGPGSGGMPSAGIPAASDVYIVNAEGAQLTDITGHHAGISEWNPAFGPDGRIYFNSDEGGPANIWSLDPGIRKPAAKASDPPPGKPLDSGLGNPVRTCDRQGSPHS